MTTTGSRGIGNTQAPPDAERRGELDVVAVVLEPRGEPDAPGAAGPKDRLHAPLASNTSPQLSRRRAVQQLQRPVEVRLAGTVRPHDDRHSVKVESNLRSDR